MTKDNQASSDSKSRECDGVLKSFQVIKELASGYFAVSVLALAAIITLRNQTHEVNAAVWTRGIIVVASALMTLVYAIGAAGGSRRSYVQLRIISIVMPVAIVAIIALPSAFPIWIKVEQGICGLLLLAIAIRANNRQTRGAFKPVTGRTGSAPLRSVSTNPHLWPSESDGYQAEPPD